MTESVYMSLATELPFIILFLILKAYNIKAYEEVKIKKTGCIILFLPLAFVIWDIASLLVKGRENNDFLIKLFCLCAISFIIELIIVAFFDKKQLFHTFLACLYDTLVIVFVINIILQFAVNGLMKDLTGVSLSIGLIGFYLILLGKKTIIGFLFDLEYRLGIYIKLLIANIIGIILCITLWILCGKNSESIFLQCMIISVINLTVGIMYQYLHNN